MKPNYLLIVMVLAFGFITSCKKDPVPKPDPEPEPGKAIVDNRPPAEVVESLTTELAKVEEISDFTEALKNVSLTQEEVSEGLTIFAPVNVNKPAPQALVSRLSTGTMLASASQERFSSKMYAEASESASLTDKELKDHIVKGIYKLADISDGTVLVTLSGKNLKFTKDGDKTWINGVKINESKVTPDGKQTIFVVSEPLSATEVDDEPAAPLAGLEVTVWDATEWSPENAMGKEASGAHVAVYLSHEDYTNDKVLFEKETDSNGKVYFENIESGTYYIVATKGDMSSVFNKWKNPGEELYHGMAAVEIFQSEAAVNAAPVQGGQPGNFRWLDANADGVIDQNDRVPLPFESVELEGGTIVPFSILIGYMDNNGMGPIRRESQVLAAMKNAESRVVSWYNEMKILDGVLSDDASAPTNPALSFMGYSELDNFSFAPNNFTITQRWNEAYYAISDINKLMDAIPNVSMANKDQALAQLRALRAAVYIQMMAYYGNVPIQKNVKMDASIVNSSRREIYNYIKQELTDSKKSISATSGQGQLNSLSVAALLSKAALINEDYTAAASYASEVISSGKYVLENPNTAFTPASKETIWGKEGHYASEFASYFFNRTFSPIIRLSEIHLIAAEANIQTGNTQKAISYLNPVLQNNSLQVLSGSENVSTLTNALRDGWKTIMPREGSRFVNLVRWGIASQVLKGFTAPRNNLLPIPQVVMDRYPGIKPNPGY